MRAQPLSPDLSKVLEELNELAFILTDRVRGKTECYVILHQITKSFWFFHQEGGSNKFIDLMLSFHDHYFKLFKALNVECGYLGSRFSMG